MGNFISKRSEEDSDSFSCSDEPNFIEMAMIKEEVEEPMDLVLLPDRLINSIINKLEYKEFGRIEETSRCMSTAINNFSFSPLHKVAFIQIYQKQTKLITWFRGQVFLKSHWYLALKKGARIQAGAVEIKCKLTNARLRRIINMFEKNKTASMFLLLKEAVTFDTELLYRLISVLGIKNMSSEKFLSEKFFTDNGCNFNNLNALFFPQTACTDAGLLALKVIRITMGSNFITDEGLNQLLEQWLNGEREINWIKIDFDTNLGNRDFDTILDGLDANPIWTPDFHEDSLISAIPLEDYDIGNPVHFYSLWEPTCAEDFRMILLRQDSFEVKIVESEATELLATLYDDQYYLVTNECRTCKQEVCPHYAWFSSQRFKRTFPRLYNAIIRGMQIAGVVVLAVQCTQHIFGVPLVGYATPYADYETIYEIEDDGSFYSWFMYKMSILRSLVAL